ncbi:MAG: hypothetical protein N2C14_24450, partial [Planctomycetales bacterium]
MNHYTILVLAATAVFWAVAPALGEEPQAPTIPRTIPPPGITIQDSDAANLRKSIDALALRFKQASRSTPADRVASRIPDAEIYLKAARYALENGEFFKPGEVQAAAELLETGGRRLDQLLADSAPWEKSRGLEVRGYRSKLDGSVQPYGLVIPEKLDLSKPNKLIVWLHGRGNTLSEVNFIRQRQTKTGNMAPSNALVLHPYGRYCNAFKFAGEVDVLEALEHAKQNYCIDEDRIASRGFSMGGAAAWQFAVHYS